MFAALKLYCMLGVSAQSTRLHISVHKYLFSFESGYFSVTARTLIIVCALLFENVNISYMYMAGFESFKNSFSLILKKKRVLSTNSASPEHYFFRAFFFTCNLTVKR